MPTSIPALYISHGSCTRLPPGEGDQASERTPTSGANATSSDATKYRSKVPKWPFHTDHYSGSNPPSLGRLLGFVHAPNADTMEFTPTPSVLAGGRPDILLAGRRFVHSQKASR
jgi:hypothetical protein